MVSLTIYGGANEVGGNKILLQDKGAKIYLDFGQGFGFGDDFFYEYLSPRKVNGLEVYFEFGMLPRVSKLYSRTMLALTDLKYRKPDVDGVFISHSHSDHIGHIPFLDEEIPVYMGHGTHLFTELYHKLYPTLVNIGEHENLHLFQSGEKIKIKHLKIEPIHVDHSIPGAYGFIVHTSKGAIVYTGDIRMHGPRSDMSIEFMKKAAKAKPIALLCEGTRIGGDEEHNFTEEEVEKKAKKIIKQSKGLVLTYFSMSNVDRFMSFYRAAIKNKRKLVIGTNLAYIIHNMRKKIPILPDVLKDKNIRVYYRLSGSCTFCEKDYYVWEREFMDKMITYKEINKHPKKFVMHLGFYKLMELVYIKPRNADFIYSMSEHYLEGDDNEKQKELWENWMDHFGIKFHMAHCSGHASKEDLLHFIKKVNPKMIIPIHTSHPEMFEGCGKKVLMIKKEKKLNLESLIEK
jgi:ribonuclease J